MTSELGQQRIAIYIYWSISQEEQSGNEIWLVNRI